MNTVPMMACGHAASAKSMGRDCCSICFGLDPKAFEVAESPNLEGRVARCSDCANTRPSAVSLPFFSYRPASVDRFYCGCRGWN